MLSLGTQEGGISGTAEGGSGGPPPSSSSAVRGGVLPGGSRDPALSAPPADPSRSDRRPAPAPAPGVPPAPALAVFGVFGVILEAVGCPGWTEPPLTCAWTALMEAPPWPSNTASHLVGSVRSNEMREGCARESECGWGIWIWGGMQGTSQGSQYEGRDFTGHDPRIGKRPIYSIGGTGFRTDPQR